MVLRIFKMIATSGFLAALECIKFVFRPGPRWGAYSALPNLLYGLRAPSKEREGEGEGKRK